MCMCVRMRVCTCVYICEGSVEVAHMQMHERCSTSEVCGQVK